jgi:hypothetical protein
MGQFNLSYGKVFGSTFFLKKGGTRPSHPTDKSKFEALNPKTQTHFI